MRPDSHREQNFPRCCGACKFAVLVEYKDELLCFHGDDVKIEHRPSGVSAVILDGVDVSFTEGDEWSRIWAKRTVFADEVCNEFSPLDPKKIIASG